jgi:hypothetical protein
MTATLPAALARWHAIAAARDARALPDLLAEDCVFHSPVVHTPQAGRARVAGYLSAALAVLGTADFRYVREIVGAHDAVLEFTTVLDGIEINGVDLIHWNDAGLIVDFKVMIRPLKAINLVHERMAAMLAAAAAARP